MPKTGGRVIPLNESRQVLIAKSQGTRKENLCALCKGGKMLCGKQSCPIVMKTYILQGASELTNSTELGGSSPPGVFVGRFGYPRVQVGPLIPPVYGDTTEMDTPEMWLGKSIEDIISFRFKIVRANHTVNVKRLNDGDRLLATTRELAMAKRPIDMEATFKRPPGTRGLLDEAAQPFGPSAPLLDLQSNNIPSLPALERAHQDTDLLAGDAVMELYGQGLPVSRIQRAFSVGAFGLEENRRLVPTRWSITAVDDTLGSRLMEQVKCLPPIEEYRVYESWQLDNRWMVVFMPASWQYELIEAWYPSTAWNPGGKNIVIYSDWEDHRGRTTYATIGGCYYAARLAVCEHLLAEGSSARVAILRETHPGYILPVGVWNVRENVRSALQGEPAIFHTLYDTLNYLQLHLDIPINRWVEQSNVLKETMFQRTLVDF